METPIVNRLLFQVDHLSSVTCDVNAVAPEKLLADFIRKFSTGITVANSIVCDILVDRQQIIVIEKPTNQTIESWPFKFVKSCKPLPIQPAVFPNRYNNVIAVTTMTEIHLFNVLNMDAAKVAEAITKELTLSRSEKSVTPVDLTHVDFALESRTLNRCFDDIENVINRIQQNSLEYQRFLARWNDAANAAKKGKSAKQKDDDKRRAAELAAITANQVKSEELMDTLQKVKLALIIVGRIRASLRSPSPTGQQYVNMLLSPLVAIVSTTNQPPLSAAPFDFVKSIDAPLFRKDTVSFIKSSINPKQLEFWKQLGEAWNVPLEEWQHEVRPYRPVFRPDNYSPYLPFLDPAVIAVSLTDAKENSVGRSSELVANVAYGSVDRSASPKPEVVVHAEPEPRASYSVSSETHPPLEIQELDDVIAAADIAENATVRTRPFSDAEFIEKLFAQNRRVVRANASYHAKNSNELNVEESEVLEFVDAAGNNLVVKNIFDEKGRAPSEIFDEISNKKAAEVRNDSKLKQWSDSDSLTPRTSRSTSASTTTTGGLETKNSESKNVIYSKPLPSASIQPQKNNSNEPVPVQVAENDDGNISDSESSVRSSNSQPRPTNSQQPGTANSISAMAAPVEPKTISDGESEDEVIEPVPMKPKPNDWLKPKKQNSFAASLKRSGARVVLVTKPREAQHAEEVSIYLSEILELLETPVGAWWRVRNADDQVGYVPVTHLQEMEFCEPEPMKRFEKKKKVVNKTEQRYDDEVLMQSAPIYQYQEAPEPVVKSKHSHRPQKSQPAEFLDDYSFSRLPNWTQSQPELVIVEQQSDSYRDYLLSRRRGSDNGPTESTPPFGAPLLAPFSSTRKNGHNFEEARKKAASVLSLMLATQVTRMSGATSQPADVNNPVVSSTDASNSGGASEQPSNNSGSMEGQAVHTQDGVSSEDSGAFKHQQVPRSLGYSDLIHVQENMDRLRGELNSKAASGQLKTRKHQKPLELSRRPKQQPYRLRYESSVEEVRKYLMQCGFTPQLVQEFGAFSGEELLAKTNLLDFEREGLQPTEIKRLFHLVLGARALAGIGTDRTTREEFENKVRNRRSTDNEQ